MTFDHRLAVTAGGLTAIDVEITITGPLRWLWTKVLGADLVKAAQPDLDGLVAAAEEASCRAIG